MSGLLSTTLCHRITLFRRPRAPSRVPIKSNLPAISSESSCICFIFPLPVVIFLLWRVYCELGGKQQNTFLLLAQYFAKNASIYGIYIYHCLQLVSVFILFAGCIYKVYILQLSVHCTALFQKEKKRRSFETTAFWLARNPWDLFLIHFIKEGAINYALLGGKETPGDSTVYYIDRRECGTTFI